MSEPVDEALRAALADRLPRYAAPDALKRRLGQRAARRPPRRRLWAAAAALAVAAALALVVTSLGVRGANVLATEALNDHLRVLYSAHPLEVESGGVHQVKPWFAGRVDFAPVVAPTDDAEFPLKGGAVGYFLDRKAAVFVYQRRLHTVTLLVFRADGLPFHEVGTRPMGAVRARAESRRGFSVVLWRAGELGYALVSDLNETELLTLGAQLATKP